MALGTKQVKKGHEKSKGEETKRRGGSLRHTQGNVVYQLGECQSSCSQLQRRQDSAFPALQHGAAVHYIWPERLPCQSPAFFSETADREIPVLAHVALAWPLEHSELVAERVPCLQT